MSFKDESLVNEFQIETNTELLKVIASTKREDYPDLREKYEEHMIQLRKEKKKGMSEYYERLKKREIEYREESKRKKAQWENYQTRYEHLMTSN